MLRPTDEAARSAAADSACLGSGSTARHRFTACIGRLSAAVGTGRARCLWKAAAVCWANALPVTASEADTALRPMLPTSAWEPWPFCVVRESCHAAMPDQPGLPSIGSGRRTGGSRRHPHLPRLATDWLHRSRGCSTMLRGCVSVKSQVSSSSGNNARLP